MTLLKRLVPGALGVTLVLHGLANTVLPLRGADAAAPGNWLEPITGLWATAVIGFVASGLGVLGVRLLRPGIVPASMLAGIAALGAQFWHADADLWPGVILSATLPVLATLYTASLPRTSTPVHRGWRTASDVLGLALLTWVIASVTLFPWHRAWGTDRKDWELALPGDHMPRTPSLEILHAVTIDAPPETVWPWLAQIGQDRGGFYSYAFLERAFGAQITNADAIHLEWQFVRPGDRVHATQPNYLGGLFGERPGWTVERVDPGHALVLRHWGAFVLTPAGEARTRLLIRSTISNDQIPAWLAAINFTAFELPHFIMQRRMMLGIKERAERTTSSDARSLQRRGTSLQTGQRS